MVPLKNFHFIFNKNVFQQFYSILKSGMLRFSNKKNVSICLQEKNENDITNILKYNCVSAMLCHV